MNPLAIVKSIWGVAQTLFGFVAALKSSKADRRARMATLFEQISDCLIVVSAEIRLGNVPHGKCAEMDTYAAELPGVIKDEVGQAKADELGTLLHSSHTVEQLAVGITQLADKEPCLREIEEAAGKFRALAHIVRAT